MSRLAASYESWPLESVRPPFITSPFSCRFESISFLVCNGAEGSKELKMWPLEIDLLSDLPDASSFRLLAHAKPLDEVTCNGPEKGISPWDSCFTWEVSFSASVDGFDAPSLLVAFLCFEISWLPVIFREPRVSGAAPRGFLIGFLVSGPRTLPLIFFLRKSSRQAHLRR